MTYNYKLLNRDEVENAGGCVETWTDKHDPERNTQSEGADAWQHMAKALKGRYIHKYPDIKKCEYTYYYDGVAVLKLYRQNGLQMFQFID